MRVLHICLSCFYIDGNGYQENLLVRQHVQDGNDVLVIASTETFDGAGGLSYCEPGRYHGNDGVTVIRLPYARWLPPMIARKLRIHPGLYRYIDDFGPDSILFHGCSGNELVTVSRYIRNHPNVLFYVDSHEDYNNSARSLVSRNFLHRLFYRNRLQRALPWIHKILCVSTESIDFLEGLYGIPRERMEFYPLGGFVLSWDEVEARRATTRKKLGLSKDIFVLIQSGKMTARKKLADALRAFSAVPGDNMRFLVAGLLTDAVRCELQALMEADPRVYFLGWKSPEELTDLLCASDIYVQPGTQSATMQHALCCGCPVVVDDVPAHKVYEPSGATLLHSALSMTDVLLAAIVGDNRQKRIMALTFAKQTLDYRVLAARVLR